MEGAGNSMLDIQQAMIGRRYTLELSLQGGITCVGSRTRLRFADGRLHYECDHLLPASCSGSCDVGWRGAGSRGAVECDQGETEYAMWTDSAGLAWIRFSLDLGNWLYRYEGVVRADGIEADYEFHEWLGQGPPAGPLAGRVQFQLDSRQ